MTSKHGHGGKHGTKNGHGSQSSENVQSTVSQQHESITISSEDASFIETREPQVVINLYRAHCFGCCCCFLLICIIMLLIILLR